VAALLARAVDKGVLVAASCSATFVLAAAGLLNGRRATTTWWLAPLLSRRFVDVDVVADQMVVQSTGVWTAGSAFAHADLMLGLMSHVAGPSLAHLVARYLVLDERVTQTRYMVMEHLRTADEAVRAVERFVVDNLHRQVTLAELAQVAKMSPRTLSRRIEHALAMTPLEFVQRQRVARAAHLLDTTNASVDDVANRVGYADAAAFRRVFRRFTGTAPRDGRGAR
jgi:transcriptional regulator GlxA family with amidase domain